MTNTTVIYYTSNREYESFENAVKKTLLENMGDLPLISVSQKPIDFGTNICVGDIGASELNILKQLRIGAINAETEFVIPFESDMLCPPDFFTFIPTRDDTLYHIKDYYIIWYNKEIFYKKRPHEFIGVVSRKCLIKTMDNLIKYMGIRKASTILRRSWKKEAFKTSASLVTMKTDKQLHHKHSFSKTDCVSKLPYWGSGIELWEKYTCKGPL